MSKKLGLIALGVFGLLGTVGHAYAIDFTLNATNTAMLGAGTTFWEANWPQMFALILAFMGIMIFPQVGKAILHRIYRAILGLFGR